MEGINESLLGNMCYFVSQLSLYPELIDDSMTVQKLGSNKQQFAELCMAIWRSCWDEKVSMMGTIKAVLLDLRRTENTPSETLRSNNFPMKLLSLYLSESVEAHAWLKLVLTPFMSGATVALPGALDALLSSMLLAVRELPRNLRFMSARFESETRGKPQHDLVLKSFLILRFICPAITLPAANGVLPKGTVIAKEQQTHLTNLTRQLQDLANGKLEDAVLKEKLDKFLDMAMQDPSNFQDWTRVDSLSFSMEVLPVVSRETLLTMLRMIASHQNDAFDNQIKRAKKLVNAVGDSSFSERFPREKPKPAGLGVVGGVSGGGGAGASGGSARNGAVARRTVVTDNSDEYDSDSDSDSDDPQAWGLCKFIRSFLYIPSVVRGEEEMDAETDSSSSVSRPRTITEQERVVYGAVGVKPPSKPPRVTVQREKKKEEGESQVAEEEEDEEESTLSSMLGLSEDKPEKTSSSSASPRLSRTSGAASPRLSMAKHVATGNSSLTEELWSM